MPPRFVSSILLRSGFKTTAKPESNIAATSEHKMCHEPKKFKKLHDNKWLCVLWPFFGGVRRRKFEKLRSLNSQNFEKSV
jgi:hypothetical protein